MPSPLNLEASDALLEQAMQYGRREMFLRFVLEPKDGLAPPWDYGSTDQDRARYFLAHFGEHLRYVPERRQWRVWASGWNEDDTGTRTTAYSFALRRAALQQMKEVEEAMQQDLDQGSKSAQKQYEEAVRRMRKSCDAYGEMPRIEAMLRAAQSFRDITRPEELWNTDPYMVGTQNGVLNLRTREFGSAKVSDYVTKYLGAAYRPGESCPKWQAFLARVQPDENLRNYLQALAGYTLTGDTSDQGFYFLYGTGANGKSVFLRILSELMGDYAEQGRRNLLEESRNSDPKHDLAMLPGKRFLYCEETSAGARVREETIKSITGGEKIVGEAKYEKPIVFQPVAKLWIAGNHRPAVEGTDLGIWRRVRLIRFSTVIPAEERIPYMELVEQLRGELPGILNWALDGLQRWRPGQLPAEVSSAVEEYRADEDDLADFVNERLEPAPGKTVDRSDVYQAYRIWAEQQGIRNIWSAKRFSRNLGERPGFASTTRRNWLGWKVRSEPVDLV